jgi:hypothetical protein
MRAVITKSHIPASGELRAAFGAIITPSVRDVAKEREVKIVEMAQGDASAPAALERTIAISSDHGGFEMKQKLGVRAALCYDKASARNSREHNHANVLTFGGRLLTQTQAEDVLRTWLATPCGGGRHAARVQKIKEIEKANFKWTPKS